MAFLSYEHMFSPAPKTKLAQRTLGALRVARSFLLLEDDYDVDWEVDQDEPGRGEQRAAYIEAAATGHRAQRRPGATAHPHRTPLRHSATARAARRAGQPTPRSQLCICPAGSTSHVGAHASSTLPPATCATVGTAARGEA
jgi:hypothetical protein